MNGKKEMVHKSKAGRPPDMDLGSGSPPKIWKEKITKRSLFWHGDKVACLVETDRLRELQGEIWDPNMAELIGKTGIVRGLTDDGDVTVQFASDTRQTFHPEALTKLNMFEVDDAVRVINDMETVKKLQTDHDHWREEMADTVGRLGKVMKMCEDGDLRVQFPDRSWIFHPACLTLYGRDVKKPKRKPAQLLKKEGIKRHSPQARVESVKSPETHTVKKNQDIPFVPEPVFKTMWSELLDHVPDSIGKGKRFEAGPGEQTIEMESVEEQSTASTTEVMLIDPPNPSIESSVEEEITEMTKQQQEDCNPTVCKGKDTPEFLKQQQEESNRTVCKRFLQDFKDIEKIGSGGYGTVFKAQHCIDKMDYAVKRVTLTADGDKVEREVQALAKLDHENVVRYNTCWKGEDFSGFEDCSSETSSGQSPVYKSIFIQMEYCGNGTLECWIVKKNETAACDVDDCLRKFQQMVQGVAYIHSQDLIHRDLKPANIFISSKGQMKIGDFGIVTSGADDLFVERTETKGTKSYMAPEQVGNTYGKEVDLFPLGLIWFELLYRYGTVCEKSKGWGHIRKCTFPPEFTNTFEIEASIIEKLLSKEPSKRPSAAALLELLNKNKFKHSQSFAKSVQTPLEA